jgi:hypothetical protein
VTLTCSFSVFPENETSGSKAHNKKIEHNDYEIFEDQISTTCGLKSFSVLFSIVESSFNEGSSLLRRSVKWRISVGILRLRRVSVIAFDDSTENSEVQFMYDYSGTLTGSKRITVSLYQYDCVTPADSSLVLYADYSTLGEISVDLDIIQDTIATSVLYSETDDATQQRLNSVLKLTTSSKPIP